MTAKIVCNQGKKSGDQNDHRNLLVYQQSIYGVTKVEIKMIIEIYWFTSKASME